MLSKVWILAPLLFQMMSCPRYWILANWKDVSRSDCASRNTMKEPTCTKWRCLNISSQHCNALLQLLRKDSTTKVGNKFLFNRQLWCTWLTHFILFPTGEPGREFNKYGPPPPGGIIPRLETPAANKDWANKRALLLSISDEDLKPQYKIDLHYDSCQFEAVLVKKNHCTYFLSI
jgi:hypothetical protein